MDFKLRLDWSKSRRNKLETAKDIACLANRDGGLLVIGVPDKPTIAGVGLADDDVLPDVTQLNEFVQQYFDPPIPAEIRIIDVAGTPYGVIAVPPFAREPHICSKDGQDEEKELIVRNGDVYVRSDAMDCRRARGPEMRSLIIRAVAATGEAIRLMLAPSSGLSAAQASSDSHPIASPALQRYPTLQAADLRPVPEPPARRIRELETLLSNAAILARSGDALIPRYLNRLGGGEGVMIRQPSRVIFEAEIGEAGIGEDDRRILSVTEASRTLKLRIRESLWEDASNIPGLRGQAVDIESLAAFTLGSFSWRLLAGGCG
ncbi:MAG: ATP-binding protein [Chloroflexi bacterium]|nr:ATP-binding protein [Chloroflexota bacterium]